jgi:hypothetical protein
MTTPPSSFGATFLAITGLCVLLFACGPAENAGPRIRPALSPISFGDIHPRPGGVAPDPNSNTYVPFEFTLLLQSVGTDTVNIQEVCIVGDAHNGEAGNTAFSLEGPDRDDIPALREAAVRITFEHGDTNRDLNGDGEPDPDQVALVIQSDAVDYPTLVVPMCARVIPTSREPQPIECNSPVTAPPEGVADRELCSRDPTETEDA